MMTVLVLLLLAAVVAAAVYYLSPVTQSDAHGLTLLCPIAQGTRNGQSFHSIVRERLQELPTGERSPFSRVPNTYLCRGYVLEDVFYQGGPDRTEEHLRSKYLVFTSNYHGDLDVYLRGMWAAAADDLRHIWELCVGFDRVNDATSFVDYIRRCEVKTTFFFNGSTDEPLDEQLKALYLKQAFSNFAFEHQGDDAEALHEAWKGFLAQTRPEEPHPRWVAGSPSGATTSG